MGLKDLKLQRPKGPTGSDDVGLLQSTKAPKLLLDRFLETLRFQALSKGSLKRTERT